ncbi:MAG: sigma-70 family RNA polymerase sigma factor [Ruminococcaceae bacterium]|nr:sigma-70 family RNA polymerase sigma factor [Oscillospiraceae bacterium]
MNRTKRKEESAPEAYFNTVYDQTVNSITKFVISKCGNILDTEDILQNIYARFYKRILQKGYNDIDNPEAFLVSIAKFEIKTYYASKKKSGVTESFSDYTDEQMVMIENEMSKTQKNFDDVLCNKLLAREIFEDIATADEVTGKIFYLYFVCDMKLADIAEELNMNLSAVKNKLYRTIERQKKKFRL